MEESFVHGMSVARVARKYGIYGNQVFQWRRMQQDGRLVPQGQSGVELLPVRLPRTTTHNRQRRVLGILRMMARPSSGDRTRRPLTSWSACARRNSRASPPSGIRRRASSCQVRRRKR